MIQSCTEALAALLGGLSNNREAILGLVPAVCRAAGAVRKAASPEQGTHKELDEDTKEALAALLLKSAALYKASASVAPSMLVYYQQCACMIVREICGDEA